MIDLARAPALALAAFVIAASGVARSIAETPTELWLAVALFGVGGPLISVGAPKIISGLFDGKSRATAMGIYITGPYLGGMLSLLLANSVFMPMFDGNWRAVVSLYAVIAGLTGLIWIGIAVLTRRVWDVAEDGPHSGLSVSALLEVLRVFEVRLLLLMAVCLFFLIHGVNNWMPEILRSHGFSVVESGYRAALLPISGIVGALLFPRLAVPERRRAVMAMLLLFALTASVLFRFPVEPLLIAGLVLHGLAAGALLTLAILVLTEVDDIPRSQMGLASGLFFSVAQIGGVIGPTTIGVLSDVSDGFGSGLLALSLVCFVLLAVVFVLSSQWRHRVE